MLQDEIDAEIVTMASKPVNSTNAQRFLWHQRAILENLDQLVPMINLYSMRHGLIMMKILPLDMLDDIRGLGKWEEPKVRKILEYIARKNLVVFNKFINCLLCSEQKDIVAILEPNLVFVANSADGDETDAGVVMGKVLYRQPEYDVYPMESRPRGYALIISNKKFDDPKIYPDRDGGEKDESSMLQLLESLFFKVIMHKDKTRNEMESILTDFSEMDHTASNAAVVVIMSHGEEKGVIGTDGFSLPFASIIQHFSSDNCIALAHRPKLFFFQACRGAKDDYGNWAKVSNTIKTNGRSAETDSRPIREEPQVNLLAPTYSHMKVCYSSYEGYASRRNTVYGTWFIQTVASVFAKHAHELSLDDLLQKVARNVRELGTMEGCLQTVDTNSVGWERNLYFNPGFYIK